MDWVFAGSILVRDNPIDPNGPPSYLASSEGAIICICNRPTGVLDLPTFNSKDLPEKRYDLRTPTIPPVGTAINLILEPLLGQK
jgi:hypothetical protein